MANQCLWICFSLFVKTEPDAVNLMPDETKHFVMERKQEWIIFTRNLCTMLFFIYVISPCVCSSPSWWVVEVIQKDQVASHITGSPGGAPAVWLLNLCLGHLCSFIWEISGKCISSITSFRKMYLILPHYPRILSFCLLNALCSFIHYINHSLLVARVPTSLFLHRGDCDIHVISPASINIYYLLDREYISIK